MHDIDDGQSMGALWRDSIMHIKKIQDFTDPPVPLSIGQGLKLWADDNIKELEAIARAAEQYINNDSLRPSQAHRNLTSALQAAGYLQEKGNE
jgi:hypothetical protein